MSEKSETAAWLRDNAPPGPLGRHMKRAADEIERLQAEAEKWRRLAFSPMGDNHHNARLCPHCNPGGATNDAR